MYKLLIWGTGKRASDYMKYKYFEGNSILGFVDSSPKKELFYDCPIFYPQTAYRMSKDVDYIIIATMHYEEIYEMLIENGVDTRFWLIPRPIC